MHLTIPAAIAAALLLSSCALGDREEPQTGESWLAGDHHIHSRYSVGYDRENLPNYTIGGDAIYPTPMNALMARTFGLSWIVTTDHGGPNHSKINFDKAYPELQQSRAALPDVIQFYGMELNTPAADHSSLIIPFTVDERERLMELESSFDKYEPWPPEPERDREQTMITALKTMAGLKEKPVVIANHPSRSATGPGAYGLDEPRELRGWNDAAPNVAVGMAGAPGHQAATLSERKVARGAYREFPTMGGFDQMTARLGGFWDSMLGEGRRWWITANSDSHVHHTEGGIDFWPGEYSKTYVYAEKSHAAILSSLRDGRIFVTTGDLVSELYVEVMGESESAEIGGSLTLPGTAEVSVRIRLRDPDVPNHNGDNPRVKRVDLIVGDVTGPVADKTVDSNDSTRVLKRFTVDDWHADGEYLSMTHVVPIKGPSYIRVRGTNTDEAEPEQDANDEDPWQDLWFYSNPVFIDMAPWPQRN
ncbi:MAG: hypothetical protein WD002_06945 [Pseudomonadales bacterium]